MRGSNNALGALMDKPGTCRQSRKDSGKPWNTSSEKLDIMGALQHNFLLEVLKKLISWMPA